MAYKIKLMWLKVLVFFSWRVWAKMQWNRPKFALCVYHGIQMKRGRKTEFGAFYHCRKCRRSYLIECKGNKPIPI